MTKHTLSLNEDEYAIVEEFLDLFRKYGNIVVGNIIEKVHHQELVAELYRTEKITFNQARELLQHATWQETAQVLKQLGCELYYDRDDYSDDLKTLRELFGNEITP